MALELLEPKVLFEFFEQISNIPRGSGNEKGISDYLVSFAKKRGLWVHQDAYYNVIIKKPGTVGYENAVPVILQGHLDMVCEKNAGTVHDFTKDPLQLYVDGDRIRAKGTTLGADNGVAVAIAMALLEDTTIAHPPLEIVMTTQEEVGLIGAANIDAQLLEGKYMLNIDSEDDGIFLLSCAGGVRVDTFLPIDTAIPKANTIPCSLFIKGLMGGHSGSEIDKKRANSIKLLARILLALNETFDIDIASLSGGAQDNAIPREAEAVFFIDPQYFQEVQGFIQSFESMIRSEYAGIDDNLCMVFTKEADTIPTVFTKASGKKVIANMLLMPNGIVDMSKNTEGLVETSNNVGVLQTTETQVRLGCAVRSSVQSKKEMLVKQIATLAEISGGWVETRGDYPGWEYKPESKIRDIASEVYEALFQKKPIMSEIHAGLECGLFAGKINDLDIISFGPDIVDAHNPDESMSIRSFGNTYLFVCKLLERFK